MCYHAPPYPDKKDILLCKLDHLLYSYPSQFPLSHPSTADMGFPVICGLGEGSNGTRQPKLLSLSGGQARSLGRVMVSEFFFPFLPYRKLCSVSCCCAHVLCWSYVAHRCSRIYVCEKCALLSVIVTAMMCDSNTECSYPWGSNITLRCMRNFALKYGNGIRETVIKGD